MLVRVFIYIDYILIKIIYLDRLYIYIDYIFVSITYLNSYSSYICIRIVRIFEFV